MLACEGGHVEVVRSLLAAGAEKGEGGVSGPSVGSASVATRATADGGVRAHHARAGGGARGAA